MATYAHCIVSALRSRRFRLGDEKRLQAEIFDAIAGIGLDVKREVNLDPRSRIDGMVGAVGIEVKIKGQRLDIYRQLERYCAFPEVEAIILVTNAAMGLPSEIGGKPAYYVSLGAGWLS